MSLTYTILVDFNEDCRKKIYFLYTNSKASLILIHPRSVAISKRTTSLMYTSRYFKMGIGNTLKIVKTYLQQSKQLLQLSFMSCATEAIFKGKNYFYIRVHNVVFEIVFCLCQTLQLFSLHEEVLSFVQRILLRALIFRINLWFCFIFCNILCGTDAFI